MKWVRLDINDPVFLTGWFALPASESLRVFDMLRKIGQLSWEQLYADRGLRWEAVKSRLGPHRNRIYSLRVTKTMRAVGYRDGDTLRFLSLHPDHDSAYQ